MTAITDRVNSVWRYLHSGTSIPVPASNGMNGDVIEHTHGGLAHPEDTGCPDVRQEPRVSPVEVECQGPDEIRLPGRKISQLDSETEIVLDGPHEKRLSPELDLR